MFPMKEPIAIALSGGIDSLMAAKLLLDGGHRLLGVHFITGYESVPAKDDRQGEITAQAGSRPVERVAARLNIPLEILDCRVEFKNRVVDYFRHTYAAGQTPNPCMVCNPLIKFGTLLNFARSRGAVRLATGHYARSGQQPNGRYGLRRGADPQKDQSYFLAFLSPRQLAQTCFPLGNLYKSDVQKMARQANLAAVVAAESQDICFIKSRKYGDFFPLTEVVDTRPGPIEDIYGNQLGHHQGLHLFTIGQRRGINCPAAAPYYVVRLDKPHNRLVVGPKEALLSTRCRVAAINWIIPEPRAVVSARVRLRYRHAAAEALIVPGSAQTAEVIFKNPQTAITPGQAAVFYADEAVLGGGWIVSE
jgi:tRNA-uridine 2-sulfurtransferase